MQDKIEENKLLIAKVVDKFEFSKTKNKITYTDFLNMAEISVAKKYLKENKINNFVFYALQQCIFSPENKDKIIKKMNEKLALHKHIQSDEINALMNKINGLENAQNNLTGYLETGRASKTILEKMQKNETELEILNKQLEAKSKEISTVDSDTYDRLICKFRNYMCNVKSPEAVALRNAAIKNILPDKDKITVTFNSGVPVDDETAEYFNEK